MKCPLFLVCLLPFIHARMMVQMYTHQDDLDKKVETFGQSLEYLNGADRRHYGLEDSALRQKIGDFFGERPDDIYLNGPTPYGDLYSVYGWTPVRKVLRGKEARVLTVNAGPTMISTQIFENINDAKATIASHIEHPVTNTVTGSWIVETDQVTIADDIRHTFSINGTSTFGSTTMKYLSKFGHDYSATFPVNIGSKTALQVNLEPNQKYVAELYANSESLSVEIDYEIILDGYVAANYILGYREHHFWSFYIIDLLNYSKIKPFVYATEIVKLTYYTNPRMILRDTFTNKVLYDVPMTFV